MLRRLSLFFGSFVVLSIGFLPLAAAAAIDSVEGKWQNADATFEVFLENGSLGARIVSLKELKTADGREKTDINNPDPAKRGRPIIGLVIMTGCKETSPGHWNNGKIYDPKSGNTYSCNVELTNPHQLTIRGYLLVSAVGRSEVWTRG